MGKVQVKVSSGKQGKKIAEGKSKVVAQAGKLPGAGKPVYKPKAKITIHLPKNKA